MGSDGGLVWTENDMKVKEVGIKLQDHQYSTTEELDDILYEGMSALMNTGQTPLAKPTRKALFHIMSGLVKDELLLHTDINIQIALAVCFIELSRISAPGRPFQDEIMQKIFPLFMVAIKQLSCEPTDWQPMHVLRYMAMAQTSLMMLDHDESGDLIIEMFQLFLNIIRPDHSSEIFESMQKIMCMVIEGVRETDDDYGDEETEIINKIVIELLHSVKMDNKKLSPMSWELGKSVLEKYATKLKPYLKEAVKSKNLKIDDYAEIIISLFRDTSNGNDMEETEVLSTHQWDVDEREVSSKSDETLSETSERCTTTPQLNSINATSVNVNSVETVEAASMEKGIMKNKRGRKPKSRYDELEWSSNVRTMLQRKVEKGSSSKGKTGVKTKEAETLSDSKNELPNEEGSGRREPVISFQSQEESNAVEKNHRIYDGDYGDDLINTRIQVWWPEDETFYSGTITAFNPIKEEHKIVYDDNEIEYLDLNKETWEPLTCKQPQEVRVVSDQEPQSSLKGKDAAINLSPAKDSVMSLEKTAKRKGRGRPPKKDGASSSKRLKGVSSCCRMENSARVLINVKDEPEQETPAINISSEALMGADKYVPKTVMTSESLKDQAGPSSSLTPQIFNKGSLEKTAKGRGRSSKKQPASSSKRSKIGSSLKSGEISAAAHINMKDEPEILELSEAVMAAVMMNESLKNQSGPSSRVTSQILNKGSLEKTSERKDIPLKKHAASPSKRPKGVSSCSRMKSGEHFAHTFIDVKDKPEQETPAINISSEVLMGADKDEPKTMMKNESLKNQTRPNNNLTSERLKKGSLENTAKRKGTPSKKQPASLSIRPKAGSGVESGENSPYASINLKDVAEQETPATNISPEVAMVEDNDVPRTLMKNQAGPSSSLTSQILNKGNSENTAKRRGRLPKKQPASLPKRSKISSSVKSEEISAAAHINLNDEPEVLEFSEVVMGAAIMNESLKNQTGPSSRATSQTLNKGSLGKTLERKDIPFKKHPVSPSKRLKGVSSCSRMKSEEHFAHTFIDVKDQPEQETPAINISSEVVMGADKDEPKTMMKYESLKNQTRPNSSLTSKRLNKGSLENTTKRKGTLSKKQHASSSIRPNAGSVWESGENSTHVSINVEDEQGTHAWLQTMNISPEVVNNDAPRTLMKNQAGPNSSLTSQRLNIGNFENKAKRRGRPQNKQPASSPKRSKIGSSVKSGEISAAAHINVNDEPELLELSEVVMGAVIMNESLKNQTGPSNRATSQTLNKGSLGKTLERKDIPLKKHPISLSKRLKGVSSCSRMKSGEHFAHAFIDLNDKPEQETPAINISSEVVMGVDKDEPKTMMKDESLNDQTGPNSSLTSKRFNKRSWENTAKKKVTPSKKQPASSYIRPKAGSGVESGENSTHASINVEDEREQRIPAWFQTMNILPDFVNNDAPKTLLKNQPAPSSSLTSQRLNIGNLENMVKRRGRPPMKQPTSSSKIVLKTGENPGHTLIELKDEPEDGTNVSTNHADVANHADKDEQKTVMEKPSRQNSQRRNRGYNPKLDPFHGFL